MPGQWMVMPEGLGESSPMPLPHVGLHEDSVAGYYAETPWRLRSPAVRPPPASRPQEPKISHRTSRTPYHADGNYPSRLVIGSSLRPWRASPPFCMPAKHEALPASAQVWMTGAADDARSRREEGVVR